MLSVLSPFLSTLFSVFRSRAALQVEILALRHQIGAVRRSRNGKGDRGGWRVLDVVVWSLGRLAVRANHRQTRDRHHLAPQRLPLVLDLEGSAQQNWKARSVARSPGLDSNDEP